MGGTVYLTEEKLQVSRGLVRDSEVRNIFGFNTAIGTNFIAAWELKKSVYSAKVF